MSHHHHQHKHHQENMHPKKGFHRGWLFTIGGILMLVAILVYILTLDETTVPGQPVPPAVTAPANPK